MRTIADLSILQGQTLELKIRRSERLIREWVEAHGADSVSVVDAGTPPAKVLIHLVHRLYPKVQVVKPGNPGKYPFRAIQGLYDEFLTYRWVRAGCNNFTPGEQQSNPLFVWLWKDIDDYYNLYLRGKEN